MNTTDKAEMIIALLDAGIVPMLQGSPGSGKTAIADQIAEHIKHELIPIIGSVLEPVDVMGLPNVSDGKAEFLSFGLFEQIYTATKPTLVLIDDLGQCDVTVQKALMQLIHGRKLNGHRIPACVKFICATNRPRDKAGVTQVISPIRGRVATVDWITECDCNGSHICDWHQWALDAGIHPTVRAFAQFRAQALSEYDSDGVNHSEQVCSARALEFLSRLETAGIPDHSALQLVNSIIGSKYGADYVCYRTMVDSLPLMSDITSNPETATLPTQLGEQIAITCLLTHQVKPETAEAVMIYTSRLPAEISVATVMGIIKKVPEIATCKPFVTWASAIAPFLLS